MSEVKKILRIGVVVGEVSGDTLGVKLMQAFKQYAMTHDIEIVFEGIGGSQMIAEGFHSFYAMETLSVMGIVEVLKDIKQLFAVRDGLVERWTQNPVDIFIGIDAPDFNLRLSKKIKDLNLPIKTVQYVSPSVWAWRQKRVFAIKKAVDLVLCLFPFEVDFYQKYQVPAVFVGHPLAQQLPLQENSVQARQQLNLQQQQRYIALLPGSRNGEVERLLPVLLSSAQLLLAKYPDLKFVIPAINQLRYQQIQQHLADYPNEIQQAVQILANDGQESNIGRLVMEACDVVALASGTATLEAMLLHRPMVVLYKLHWLTYFIVKRLIKISSYSLPNIIAKQPYVVELIQNEANAQRLSQEIELLLTQGQQQQQQHRQLHQQLQQNQQMNIVEVLLALLSKGRC